MLIAKKIKLPRGFKEVGPYRLYNYQKEAFIFGISLKRCGLLLEMGLGKTLVSINILRYLFQKNEAKKVLIVCPSSIIYNWEDAINTSSEYEALVISDTNKSDRNYKFRYSDARFNIINYEGLFPSLRDLEIVQKKKVKKASGKIETQFLYNKNYQKMLKNLGYDSIIFDESSRYMKSHDSDRSRSCILLSDFAKNKFLLTGTLISNKPTDLYTQFRVMRGVGVFGENFYRFRNGFFKKDKYTWTLRHDKIKALNAIIYKYCIRKTIDECLPDLPPAIYNKIILKYDTTARNIYDGVRNKVIKEISTELGKAHVNITNIYTQLLRLQQITSGFIKDEDTEKLQKLKNTPKLDSLIDHIETVIDNKSSIIVWCKFRFTIHMIAEMLEKLKSPYITMSGEDNSAKKKYKKWKTFQTTNCPVFIGQVESGGFGIELYKEKYIADKQYMIFYENVWDLSVKEQAGARIKRRGQKSISIITDLVIENTIDERILKTISTNKTIADMIMEKGAYII